MSLSPSFQGLCSVGDPNGSAPDREVRHLFEEIALVFDELLEKTVTAGGYVHVCVSVYISPVLVQWSCLETHSIDLSQLYQDLSENSHLSKQVRKVSSSPRLIRGTSVKPGSCFILRLEHVNGAWYLLIKNALVSNCWVSIEGDAGYNNSIMLKGCVRQCRCLTSSTKWVPVTHRESEPVLHRPAQHNLQIQQGFKYHFS